MGICSWGKGYVRKGNGAGEVGFCEGFGCEACLVCGVSSGGRWMWSLLVCRV